jgi:hypothetical protein
MKKAKKKPTNKLKISSPSKGVRKDIFGETEL